MSNYGEITLWILKTFLIVGRINYEVGRSATQIQTVKKAGITTYPKHGFQRRAFKKNKKPVSQLSTAYVHPGGGVTVQIAL